MYEYFLSRFASAEGKRGGEFYTAPRSVAKLLVAMLEPYRAATAREIEQCSLIAGDEILSAIARELVEKVRKNVTIDWTLREDVRAKLRVLVKRTLRSHNFCVNTGRLDYMGKVASAIAGVTSGSHGLGPCALLWIYHRLSHGVTPTKPRITSMSRCRLTQSASFSNSVS